MISSFPEGGWKVRIGCLCANEELGVLYVMGAAPLAPLHQFDIRVIDEDA